MSSLDELITVADFERRAAELLPPGPGNFYEGGAGDEVTLHENREAFRRLQFRPRVLVDVSGCTTRTTVLGQEIALPVVVAPFAFPEFAHAEGVSGVARAAAAAGTLHAVSALVDVSPAELAATAPDGRFIWQVYWYGRDPGLTKALFGLAAEASFTAIMITIDAPRVSRRERDIRSRWAPDPGKVVPALVAATGGKLATLADLRARSADTMTWDHLADIAAWSSLPVIVKGVMTAEDARLAGENGAAAVVVSNHGGRQIDEVAGGIDLLPEVAEAVGDRLEVWVDSGIRRGSDVVKALALGARAVLVGRPAVWGLACGGQAGVERVLSLLQAEVEVCLALLGVTSPGAVGPQHVQRAPG